MATDGPTPKPCDPKIFKKGKPVASLSASSNAVETWVKVVAKMANAKVDWHYSGGRAQVLHLGDAKSRARVEQAIDKLAPTLKGTILQRFGESNVGLYRNGVTPDSVSVLGGAVVREINDQLVLDDPVAVGVIHAVEKYNCHNTLEMNADRVSYFKRRLAERGMSAKDAVITVINVDDVHGGPIADALMPGTNWQEIRDRGEVPFARGLAMRDGVQELLGTFDKEAAKKLRDMADVAVVVVDHGVAEVFVA
jgi:hypothetical protein